MVSMSSTEPFNISQARLMPNSPQNFSIRFAFAFQPSLQGTGVNVQYLANHLYRLTQHTQARLQQALDLFFKGLLFYVRQQAVQNHGLRLVVC